VYVSKIISFSLTVIVCEPVVKIVAFTEVILPSLSESLYHIKSPSLNVALSSDCFMSSNEPDSYPTFAASEMNK
jgi:hypothetical protein